MENKEDRLAAYWITVAHIPGWTNAKINKLITAIYKTNNSNWEEFFSLSSSDWKQLYDLNSQDCETLLKIKNKIASNAFLAESLYNQGYELIPLIHSDYSPILKYNLKLTYSPPLLYIKGNKELLKKHSVAIVGSRDASEISLKFTENIAKKALENDEVIVSGFARGVDRTALNSALKYKGESIIVLPQGIMTFESGFKNYYKPILDGKILVLSVFHPQVHWNVKLAMARNPVIYGLAEKIYVAEASSRGGTYQGVIDGLRRGRKIYIRIPAENENNANKEILNIDGTIPVDMFGKEMEPIKKTTDSINAEKEIEDLNTQIKKAISIKPRTAKEICTITGSDWSPQKMSKFLKNLDFLETFKVGNTNKYRIKGAIEEQVTIDFN